MKADSCPSDGNGPGKGTAGAGPAEGRRRRPFPFSNPEPGSHEREVVERALGEPEEVISSQIDGTFEGWRGGTTFRLRNGQRWRQTSYSCIFRNSYAPRVEIRRSRGGWEMRVEGVAEAIPVVRVW